MRITLYFCAVFLLVATSPRPVLSDDTATGCAALQGVASSRLSLTSGKAIYTLRLPAVENFRDIGEVSQLTIEWDGDKFRAVRKIADPNGVPVVEVCSRNATNVLIHNEAGGTELEIAKMKVPIFGFDPRLLGITPGPTPDMFAREKLFSECSQTVKEVSQVTLDGGGQATRVLTQPEPKWSVEYLVDVKNDFRLISSTYLSGGYRYVNEYKNGEILPSTVKFQMRIDGRYQSVSEFVLDDVEFDLSFSEDIFEIEGLMMDIGDEFLDDAKSKRLGYWDGEKLVDRRPAAFQNAFERGEFEQVDSGSGWLRWLGLTIAGCSLVGWYVFRRRSEASAA